MNVENEQHPHHKILVVGMTAAGADSLPAAMIDRILAADLLAGGKRHLGYFSQFQGETVPITSAVETVAQRLHDARAGGMRCVVLASGDPLCYGMGASLRRYFAADELEIVPAPTAFQLAFAALGEPWHDALLLSAHGRPLADVVEQIQLKIENRKLKIENASPPIAAILTDNEHTPSAIAKALIDAGLSGDRGCAVCENLGADKERVIRTDLATAAQGEFAALNVFVICKAQVLPHPSSPQTGREVSRDDQSRGKSIESEYSVTAPFPKLAAVRERPGGGLGWDRKWGNPDTMFTTSAAQITKREVRLLALAELQLEPNGVLWDVGAGSGSVGIEAALGQPGARVYAVEKRAEFVEHMHKNVAQFGVENGTIIHGSAPDACADWPDPSAIFVGGSGGRLVDIIEMAKARLRDGGRLVINLATLENLQTTRDLLPDARVNQVQISRGAPIAGMTRFEALNPIFMIVWEKRID